MAINFAEMGQWEGRIERDKVTALGEGRGQTGERFCRKGCNRQMERPDRRFIRLPWPARPSWLIQIV